MPTVTMARGTSRRRPLRAATAVAAMAAGLLVLAEPGSSASLLAASRASSEPGTARTISTGWTTPWGVSWLPDGSALVNEAETFKIFRLTQSGAKILVGTVPETVTTKQEDGLLGIAVSPHWQQDHYIYLFHSASEGNRIARMTYDGSALGDYHVLLSGIARADWHNGGRLVFGPDGYLYAATGDSEHQELAQDKNSLNGKILRLTVEGKPAPGNPFGTYVYSYGHRNPEGLAFDPEGRLWASEIGPESNDELNLIEPGKNYGWPTCTGPCDTPGMTNPKATWAVTEASPSGLVYADGSLYMASLRGMRLWRIPVSGTGVGTPVAYYTNQYGRLRTVVKVPGRNTLWVFTCNSDHNGTQPDGSDQVLETDLKSSAS
ncbi:PQQ-dependent sugar dehydrogenase [Streptomyces olivochromogenes]|uniref:PQQ-dependent sugar dehydrogenase n=1 Tax=Streptomyces olivochromogenes TaxID=1963 RepID=UPI001F23B642|nr:PQQ-dependent sugar dehydrogenase [Streptomyces olivochromogenes]